MANQNFRVKKGIEVGLGATFLYADDSGVGINSTSPRSNLDVRGRSQTEDLLVDNYAEVQGPSTFVGVGTFQDDLYVGNNLYVKGNLAFTSFESEFGNVTGILTANKLNVTGVSTFAKPATFQQDILVSGASTLTGIVTTGDDLYVGGSLYVYNDIFYDEITGRNLSISGLATVRQLEIQQDLEVAGLSTFVGLVSFRDAVGTALTLHNLTAHTGNFVEINVDGGGGGGGGTGIDSTSVNTDFLNVSGVATFNQGIATNFSAEFIDAGVTTTTDLHFTNGFGVNLNMSGITTVGIITVYENIFDSKGQVGYGQSLLVSEGGKLLWSRADVAGIATSFQPGSTFYVAENGSDDNDGLSPEKPWASIAYAVTQIPDTSHDILNVGAGEFIETFPITVPKGLTIQGAGQRATLIKPSQATETNDGFLLNDRSTIQDVTVRGFYKPVATQNYAFKLAVGAALTSRSPYVDRVTVLNQGTNITAADPYGYNSANSYPTQAPAGGGIQIDGSVVDAVSPYASILANEVTLFTPGSRGIELSNGGRMEWLNGFVYFASEALVGISDRSAGLAGQGKTRLTLENASGGLSGGNTIEYYDSDGTTVLASGTIDNVSGSYVTLTNSGVGTFAVPRNRAAKKVDFVNGAQLSTAQQRFGTSSLDLTGGGTDNITVDSSADFGFGTGDFTVEFWIYRTSGISGKTIIDFRDTAATDSAISLEGNGSNATIVYIGNTPIITGTVATTLNGWHHIAIVRNGSTITQYIDGVASGSATAATDLGVARQLTLGDKFDNSNNGPSAFFDELRITKGAAKYTGAFTAPSSALTGDKDTSILLHFDGINGATSTTDDILVFQDIRITGGNTADKVTLADYSQFGADLRSIACAIEYGNQGIIANGDGVTLRAISLNFNHVGSLGDFTNDPNLAVQANEVIELNGGQVSYVSIDQKGDFRVGEAFYVNQETGEVSFTDTVTDLTALSSLTITDGTNSSTITPTSGRFGNVLISGQNVESVTGDLNLKTGGSGEINIFGNTNVIGILTAQIIEINAIQKGDTAIALDDTGTDGTIRFITDGQEAQRITNQQRVGINTTTPVTQLEVKGGTQLENLNVVGVATLNGTGIATIGGDPDFRNLNVTGVSTFAGVGTFGSDLYVAGDLYVGDDIFLDEIEARNLKVTGITTLNQTEVADISVSGHSQLNTLNAGVSTVSQLEVSGSSLHTGVSTFNNNVTINGDLNINGSQNVDSFGTRDLSVTGVATINQAEIATGIVTNLTADRTTTTDLRVTGLSTFVGVATFANDVFVSGNLNVLGDISYDEVNGRNLNISGIATIGFASITDARIGVATIETLDVTTINVDGGGGGGSQIDENSVVTENLVVSGIATINDLRATVGNVTELVAGVSTFTGIVTTLGDLYVGGDLFVYNDIQYDEINGRNLNITGVSTLGFASITDLRVSGVATFLGDVEIGGAQIVDAIETGDLTVTGVTTTKELRFTDAVGVGLTLTNLVVTGDAQLNGSGIVTAGQDINFRNLGISGLSTFVGLVSFRSAVGTALTIFNLNVPDNGIVSLPGIPVSGGDAEFRNLNITGVSSFAGVSTFGSDVFVDGNLVVDGIQFNETLAGINLYVSGIGSVTELHSNVGLITHLQAGVSTFTGIATFASDVYVDGNLNVKGDIRYDEVNGRNLNISGIATIGYSSITDANIGVATISTLSFDTGVGSTLTVTDLNVLGDANLNGSGIVTDGSDVRFRNLSVTGLSTLTGIVTTGDDLYVGGNLYVFNDIYYDEVNGRNLNISGIATIGFASITDARIGVITTTKLDSDDFISIGSSLIPDTDDVYDLGSPTNGYRDVYGDSLRTKEDFIILQANEGVDIVDENGSSLVTVNQSLDKTTFNTDIDAKAINATEEVTVVRSSESDLAFVARVGTTTNFTVTAGGDITGRNANLSGVTTFADGVGAALTITNLVVTGDADLNGAGIVTDGSDVRFRNLNVTGLSTFVGVATFQDDLYVAGNLNVLGDLTYDEVNGRNLNISGIATIGFASITDLRVSGVTTFLGPVNIDGGQQTDFIQTTDLIVTGVATVGQATVTKLIADHADMRNLNVSGIATIGSLITDGDGTLVVDGATIITGIVTVGDNSIVLDGRKDVESIRLGDTGRAFISGITTDGARTYLKFDDGRFDRLSATGITTIGTVLVGGASTSSGIGITLTSYGDATFSGIVTAREIEVGFITARRAFIGILTVGNVDGGGSDIGNDIRTRNLKVTGITTTDSLEVTNHSSLGSLSVSGISTLTNELEIRSDDGAPGRIDFYCEVSNAHYTRLQSAPHSEYSGMPVVVLPRVSGDLIVGNSSTSITENIHTTGIITAAAFVGDGSQLVGVSTIMSMVGDSAPSARPDGTDLLNGDLWYDSDGLRQYTYYADGVSAYWVDSNPQTTIPPLVFTGNSGVDGSIDIRTETLNILGTGNIVTVGSGKTLTIGLTTSFVIDSITVEEVTADYINVRDANVSGMMTAQNYMSLSDERLKSDIEPIENALVKVLELDGVRFIWDESGVTDMGVIAQQVEEVFPEVVTTSKDDVKSVNYNGLIGVLIESVKELKLENDELKSRLDKLENR